MARRPSSGITMKQVAAHAGVSIAAVSKVLHGRGDNVRVSDATALTIRQSATELNYTPNLLARSLRMNRTHTVGLVFENFGEIAAGPLYYVHLLDGVASLLFKHRYRLTILSEVVANEVPYLLGGGQLDGLIWCKIPEDQCLLDMLHSCSTPVVALNSPSPLVDPTLPYICCDNEGGAALVAEHLAGLGHKKIAFAQEVGEENTPDALSRLKGFRTAMQELGLSFTDRDVVTWNRESYELADWHKTNPEYTAIFAWNERLGAEILKRANESNIPVPTRLSIVGFDSTQYCETTTPRMTAVRQPIHDMAATAAKTLLSMIEGEMPRDRCRLFSCELDVRDSTGIAYSLSMESNKT